MTQPEPATDRTELRDRIAQALSDARRPGLGGMTEAAAVAYMADAVLAVLPAELLRAQSEAYQYRTALQGVARRAAVLPASVDRADVYAEVADLLAADAEQGAKEGFTRIYRRSAAKQVREWGAELRRVAAETRNTTEAGESCDHDSQVIEHEGDHFWACLKCGTNLGRVDDATPPAGGAPQPICKCPAEICQCGHHQAAQPKEARP